MIIQRLASAIRNQNWSQIITEILIVVIGIFLGLQVTEWNDRRKDKDDANIFLTRLHEDLVLAEAASERVLARRFSTFNDLTSAMKVLVSGGEQESLEDEECTAIASSTILNIVIGDLPSLIELQSTGRIGIIENNDLRRSAISLQQRIISLKETIQHMTSQNFDLSMRYPDLFSLASVIDPQLDEPHLRYGCDLEAMRANAGFMFSVSTNFDVFDAYVRDGLRPWKEQFDTLHDLTDQHLGLNHSPNANH